ncbi:hypothetical protein BDR06DRAFT_482846 [Suillus hirtellus]|nr:hypothetical protein BDR06DRAFT_482846 [Suillus hirtellus]
MKRHTFEFTSGSLVTFLMRVGGSGGSLQFGVSVSIFSCQNERRNSLRSSPNYTYGATLKSRWEDLSIQILVTVTLD